MQVIPCGGVDPDTPIAEAEVLRRSFWLKLRVIHRLFAIVSVGLWPKMAVTSTVTTLSSDVGESIPPDTAHVTIYLPSVETSNADATQGRIRFLANMESERWI